MPKYYCDYCDTYLTHDSPSVRKTHCSGRKHKENVRIYYQKWLEEQVQKLVDDTTAAFKAGKIQNNPFAPGGKGAAIPPPVMPGPPKVLKPNLPGPMPNLPPNMPPGAMGMPMPMGGPMPMMGPGPMPGMLGMRPMGPMGPMMGGPMGMRPMMSGPGAPGTAPPPRK